MHDVPPTSPGPVPITPATRLHPIARGVMMHCGCVLLACFVVPLAMNSNIWPIAGVFWSVLTVPVGAGTGALTAWLLGGLGGRGLRPQLATGLLVITGLLVATAVGVIIANNR